MVPRYKEPDVKVFVVMNRVSFRSFSAVSQHMRSCLIPLKKETGGRSVEEKTSVESINRQRERLEPSSSECAMAVQASFC